MVDFINRPFIRYEGVKLVKNKDLGSQGYIRLPKWLLGCIVTVYDSGLDMSSDKLVVSSLGGAALLFHGSFIGKRFRVSYKKQT